MDYLSLFSGVGGGDLGLQHLLNWTCKGYVEYEPFCQKVIKQRIKDSLLDTAPIFGDIKQLTEEGYAKSLREWLIASQGDSLVNHSQSPESERVQTMNEICGLRLCELSKSSDQNMLSWKTSQGFFQVDISERFFADSMPQGMMRNGACYRLKRLALHIKGQGSGLQQKWRTPANKEPGVNVDRLEPIEGGELGGMNRHFDKETGRMAQIGLTQQVQGRQNWLTPSTIAIEGGEDRVEKRTAYRKSIGRQYVPGCLAEQVKWPTPRALVFDNIEYGGAVHKHHVKRYYLEGTVIDKEGKSGQLNPDWVEWLMGWPIGWSSLEPIKELIWLSWDVDPADMEVPVKWPSAQVMDVLKPRDNKKLRKWNNERDGRKNRQVLSNLREAIHDGYYPQINTGSIPRVATGIKDRVSRLKAIGNGIMPICAATAWKILTNEKGY